MLYHCYFYHFEFHDHYIIWTCLVGVCLGLRDILEMGYYRVLEHSLQEQRRDLRDCVDSQGGDFWGSAILEKFYGLFWFYWEEANSRVSAFSEEGNSPKSSFDSSSSNSTIVLRQFGRSSKRGHFLTILSVFLHLPCASRGATCLITSCTLSITQYNKMA